MSDTRHAWLDVARGYGIFLVFYGHLVEPFADQRLPGAFATFKFVYAFHMPLFFVLSGWLGKHSQPFGDALRRGLLGRIVPAIFFNLLVMTLWLPPSPIAAGLPDGALGEGLVRILQGRPNFNFQTWFLYCLFAVELIHVGLRRVAKSDAAIALSILCLFGIGQAIAFRLDAFAQATGLPKHLWYVDEALVAAAFHQVGFLAARLSLRVKEPLTAAFAGCAGVAALGATLLLSDLNQGPFTWYKPIVTMSMSSHGHVLWFPLAALAGAAAVMALARATERNRVAAWLGRHSLPLFGLNTLWITFLNPALPVYFAEALPRESLGLGALLLLGGAVSLALTAPLAWALVRGVPQLVGHPRADGPWLPALYRARDPAGSGG